jgi:protein gp37
MADHTKIEWTDASWNPIRAIYGHEEMVRAGWHCEHVSEECEECYAEVINRRLGTTLGFRRQDRDKVEISIAEHILEQPLRWKRPRRIFVCSMTDLFGEFVPEWMIDQVFAVMASCQRHTFQVLTKRPERMRAYLLDPETPGRVDCLIEDCIAQYVDPLDRRSDDMRATARCLEDGPLPNVWLGVSAGTQKAADSRIPLLLQTPAAIRFVSYEPALGPITLDWLGPDGYPSAGINSLTGERRGSHEEPERSTWGTRLDWVIVGGESGPRARPFNLAWARSVVKKCRGANVACFVKQLGSVPIMGEVAWRSLSRTPILNAAPHNRKVCPSDCVPLKFNHSKGGDIDEWPLDLRVRQWPETPALKGATA